MPELWKQQDSAYCVRAYTTTNRGRVVYMVRAWWRGRNRAAEARPRKCRSADEAIGYAMAEWRYYTTGGRRDSAPRPETLGTARDAWVAREDLSKATAASYSQVAGLLCTRLGDDYPLQRLSARELRAWLDSLSCSATSRNTYLRTIRAWVRWMVAEGLLLDDLTAKLSYTRTSHVMRPWLPRTEWGPYLDACAPAHRLRSEFVLHTGLRAEELCSAEWSHVIQPDIGLWQLNVPTSKSGRARAIPLDSRARAVLEECRKEWGGDGLIFSAQKISKSNLSRRTHQACRRADVTDTDFHGLRRSCGARWLADGMEMAYVSRLLGHQDVSTTMRHYGGIADRSLQAAIARMDAAAEVAQIGAGKSECNLSAGRKKKKSGANTGT